MRVIFFLVLLATVMTSLALLTESGQDKDSSVSLAASQPQEAILPPPHERRLHSRHAVDAWKSRRAGGTRARSS